MVTLFRKIRAKLIGAKNFKNYIAYAIGEIFLVVVGILIALSINNWNEERKHKEGLNAVLQTIKQNLESDLEMLNDVKGNYTQKIPKMDSLISGLYTLEELKNNPACWNLTTNFSELIINTKGYEQLKVYADSDQMQTDSLFNHIILFYQRGIKTSNILTDKIQNETFGSISHMRNFDFFSGYTGGAPNEEFFQYLESDPTHRNNLAMLKLLIEGNYLPLLSAYKEDANSLVEAIESRR